MNLKSLVGSGDRIGLFLLPFVVAGLAIDALAPALFAISRSDVVMAIGLVLLVPGLIVWAWSAILILNEVPRGRLITSGPYALVKHPLYTGVALLILPGLGFLLGTWLGLLFGLVLYVGARIFSAGEERALRTTFGAAWDEYAANVRLSWL